MTGKTSPETYAVIEAPDPECLSFTWTGTIYRRGFKRTEELLAYSEASLKDMCRARGVNQFRSADVAEPAEAPPVQP